MFFKKSHLSILIAVFLLVLGGCASSNASSNADGDKKEKKEIKMGQTNWAENIAVTNMWKVILEDEGYTLKLDLLDMGTQMAAASSGDLDIAPEVWLPVQDANYLKQYKDKVDFSEETWYDTAKVGLVVPQYMDDINSVKDLNAHKDEFDGKITGFDPGAGTMEVTEDLIEEYNLDFELMPSSEPAMITTIAEAIKEKEAVVAPLWSPHRVFSEMDLKYLDDPKNVYGEEEKIHHATRQGFADDFPDVASWLKNWKMNDDEIGELMSYVNDADKPEEGAAKWVDDNQDLVNKWLEK